MSLGLRSWHRITASSLCLRSRISTQAQGSGGFSTDEVVDPKSAYELGEDGLAQASFHRQSIAAPSLLEHRRWGFHQAVFVLKRGTVGGVLEAGVD